MVEAFDERRRVIAAELASMPGFSVSRPEGAFYVMPNITGTGLGSTPMQDFLLDELGIATVSGTSFGAFGEGYIRFSYAASLEDIREAMAKIRACAEAAGWGAGRRRARSLKARRPSRQAYQGGSCIGSGAWRNCFDLAILDNDFRRLRSTASPRCLPFRVRTPDWERPGAVAPTGDGALRRGSG